MFGEKIKVFAKKKFGSLNDLSNIMGVSPNQISSYTTENRKPGFEMLQKLYYNGCDIGWLLDDNRPINEFFDNEAKKNADDSTASYFTPEQLEAIKGIFAAFQTKFNKK